MTTFTLLAAMLAFLAVAWLCWPLFRSGGEDRAVAPLVAAAVLLPAIAFGMYLKTTNWDWQAAAAAGPSVQDQLDQLQEAADQSPGNIDRLMALGAGYASFNRWTEATEVYRKAWDLTGRQNPSVGLELAMAMTNADASTLTGEAAPLIEGALAAEPVAPKALWLGGLLAARQGNPEAAKERWRALLALNPPPEVAQLLEQSIATLGGSATTEEAPAAPGGTVVDVTVSLSPSLADRVPADAALFLLARDPSQPGPPFAAQRRGAGELPLTAQLSDADAMMPGRTMSTAQRLTIVARISRSGQPTAGSGDLFGEASWKPGQSGKLSIVIDQQIP
jgi:cytochrome c-type biogenesis protein CcmH